MSDDEQRDRKRHKKEKKGKKEKKEKKEKEKKPKLHQLVGYTNEQNPFGDTNLHQVGRLRCAFLPKLEYPIADITLHRVFQRKLPLVNIRPAFCGQKFLWKKKSEKDGTDDTKMSKSAKEAKDQHFFEEIQKVRARRSEREAEQEEQERLRAEEARLREAEQYSDWHQKEEAFHLEQARVRSKIRLVEGREKPIDILAKNIILLSKEDEEEELGSKVGVCAVAFVRLTPALASAPTPVALRFMQRTADISSLEVELREPHTIFEGLDADELGELLRDIETYQELEGAGPNRDFWLALEVVCQREIETASLGGHGANVHSSVMAELTATFTGKSSRELEASRVDIQSKLDDNDGSLDVEFWEAVLEQLRVHRAKADLKEFHQNLLHKWLEVIEKKKSDLRQYREAHPEVVRAEEEAATASVAAASKAAAAGGGGEGDVTGDAMVRAEAARGLEDLEEEMGLTDEVRLAESSYWWADKYRPRKPRYFNRVRTGYEWNKYNQTHYDHDNPPPKTVQGYKFTIFYPDLIDRTLTPKYICEPADTKEFMILRFTGGGNCTP